MKELFTKGWAGFRKPTGIVQYHRLPIVGALPPSGRKGSVWRGFPVGLCRKVGAGETNTQPYLLLTHSSPATPLTG